MSFSGIQSWLGLPTIAIAIALVLAVIGARLTISSANWLLILAFGLVAASVPYLPVLSGRPMIPRFLWTLLLSSIVGLILYQLKWTEKPSETVTASASPSQPFAFKVESTNFTPGRSISSIFWYVSSSNKGKAIFPVHMVLYLSLQNLQSIPTLIRNYAVEIEDGTHGWLPLDRLDTRFGTIYATTPEHTFQDAVRFDRRNGFDVMLTDRALQPKELVLGIAVFEYPPAFTSLASRRYRLSVSDAEGNVSSEIQEEQPSLSGSLVGAKLITDGTENISGALVKFYRDH